MAVVAYHRRAVNATTEPHLAPSALGLRPAEGTWCHLHRILNPLFHGFRRLNAGRIIRDGPPLRVDVFDVRWPDSTLIEPIHIHIVRWMVGGPDVLSHQVPVGDVANLLAWLESPEIWVQARTLERKDLSI